MSKPDQLRDNLVGMPFEQDRLWRISGPDFVAGMTDYNDEITGFAPILAGIFGRLAVHYGGNAYYVRNEAERRGFRVEQIKDMK